MSENKLTGSAEERCFVLLKEEIISISSTLSNTIHNYYESVTDKEKIYFLDCMIFDAKRLKAKLNDMQTFKEEKQ